ncbi:MAG: 5-formyltetrahydrofolate cyclo-ligase [Gammaproteobacteria bacterium]|uniref:5-formyltetrahydrofolate cyclo-ligase n=1 Tax=SAR86 cluster bacterium TaxID=2030880 RepID=A0A368C7Q6_9GAMM|nr:MAG: 5-formyltetrahydrofolate cyclo-ligase [SAR86 cluster bacterium]RPG41460.1 MAG: 5-formyltetrahydrofolate cyclo-ligase [Gammaproteobacteria bacterium TMED186]
MMKTKFRKSLKHQLSLMSESEIIKKSANIQSRCMNYIDSVDHYNVLIYMSFRSEVRTNILIEELFSNKKEVYIPKIMHGNTLCFNRYIDGDDLVLNKFNILESIQEDELLPQNFDLIILPLVGVDQNGNRLGYGGGYYDRALQYINNLEKPKIIGLGYQFQVMENIFGENHDVKFDLVFTEKDIISY